MAKQKTLPAPSFIGGMFQAGLYKRTQGRIARQVTFVVMLLTFAMAAYSLFYGLRPLTNLPSWANALQLKIALPSLLLGIGAWFSYRMVNYHVFADFLIAVEAEMNKVSWPTRGELIRSSIVVLVVIFGLMFLLFAFDWLWSSLFTWIGVVRR